MNRRLEFLLLMALAIMYFAWFAWPLVWTASENSRLVSVFESDEATHLQMLKEAISQRTLKLEFKDYGHLEFNVALLPLLLLSYFTKVSEQQIIVVLRLVPTVFAIATIAITFLLTQRYFGRLAAWLATSLLSIVPLNFLHWSVTSHPDIPQVFFLVLGVYFCCRLVEEEHSMWLIWASASAGLAQACKYSGIFLLPVVWMVGVTQTISRSYSGQIKSRPVRFTMVARYVTALIGIISVIIGVTFTPDFVARYLVVNGSLKVPPYIPILNSMRIIAIFVGCGLMLLAILRSIWATIERTPKLANSLNKVFLSLAAFSVAFFLSSPFSFVRLQFLQGMISKSRHVAFGKGFEASSNGLLWFHVLLGPQLLDKLILSLVVISLILSIYHISRGGRGRLLSPEGVMWAWVILYMGFLILRVKTRNPRDLLPVIPFLIILSAQPVNQAIEYATSKLSTKLVAVLAVVILLVIGGLELPKSLSRIFEYRQSTISREQTSTSVKAGQWLAEQYPASTRILYDHYSYVPPSFPDAHVTWGGDIQLLEALDPDVMIVNRVISDRFSDIRRATEYVTGESDFKKKYEYYAALKDGKVGYTLIRDFGDIQVYAKQ